MPFCSILFGDSEVSPELNSQPVPDCFRDLHLDQIVASLTAGREEYNLEPFFYIPLSNIEIINFRHEVFRDLEDENISAHFHPFAQSMRLMREQLALADKLYYARQKQALFLDAVDTYYHAVQRLRRELTIARPKSQGLRDFLGYLNTYVETPDFVLLVQETEKLKEGLKAARYSLDIVGTRIVIDGYKSEPDYGAEVIETFQKFKQSAPKAYQFEFPSGLEMNHIEAVILDLVSQLYPDLFQTLDEYFVRRRFYLDKTVQRFDREVQFYLACIEKTQIYKKEGLCFCFPVLSRESKNLRVEEVFDWALAHKLMGEKARIVTNDFYLTEPERIIVVSGPNQGGKTTFARTFGQVHYLASLGCPVPGKNAHLFLFDRLFTHFEREEDLGNLSGKLEDDLRRIHSILEQATPNSILIMNESFSSTTSNDALFLSNKIMAQIVELDMLCVSVTFLDELASFSETTVSMVGTVRPEDTAQRTFKVIRKAADGLAYAAAIAMKYRLDYKALRKRITS